MPTILFQTIPSFFKVPSHILFATVPFCLNSFHFQSHSILFNPHSILFFFTFCHVSNLSNPFSRVGSCFKLLPLLHQHFSCTPRFEQIIFNKLFQTVAFQLSHFSPIPKYIISIILYFTQLFTSLTLREICSVWRGRGGGAMIKRFAQNGLAF